jgi:GAF domain-containing protein
VNVIGQGVMTFSRAFYDPFFDVAHVYKVLGYVIPLFGFLLYQVSTIVQYKRMEQAWHLDESRLETLLQLNQMTDAPLHEFTDFALEEAVRLTQSKIGYLAFMNEDETVLTIYSWSKTAMQQCAIINKPIVYQVVNTGLWGEAVRQRKPVITNDYQAANPWKKGYPQGHVHVLRHMNTPIFDGQRIVIVAGVGNKDSPYDESDIRQLTLLMQGMWQLTQRQRAQEALRQAHGELEIRVQERTAELVQVNKHLHREITERQRVEEDLRQTAAELGRSNAELEQFAYVASHDLQEPLRKVQAFGDILVAQYREALGEEGRDFLQRMQNASKRMQTLINDLLTFSRVTTRGQPFQQVDLGLVARQVLQDLEIRLRETQGQVEIGQLLMLEADPVQMRQLLQNLIGNALKFHRPGVPPVVKVQARPYNHGDSRVPPVPPRYRSGKLPSRTMVSASRRSTCRGFSRLFSACTAGRNTMGAGWGWPSAARSSNGMAAASQREVYPVRAPPSWSGCP